MTRRPRTLDERKAQVRGYVFLAAIVVIVLLVAGTIVIFGAFMERFGDI